MSVPDTVNILTFWFSSASLLTIFLNTKTHFWKWKNIIRFLHSSLFSTRISLTLDNTWMENAIQSRLFECIRNTSSKRFTFELLLNFYISSNFVRVWNSFGNKYKVLKVRRIHSWQCIKLSIPSFFVNFAIGGSICIICLKKLFDNHFSDWVVTVT